MKIPNKQKALDALEREYLAGDPEPEHTNGSNGNHPPADVPDELVIRKALGADNGAELERLYRGDTSDYGGDHSRADEGFVWRLWFWTQDPEQIRRIHAGSGLSRSKSTRRRDYLERSIKNAAGSGMETYDWSTSAEFSPLRVGAPLDTSVVDSRSRSLSSTGIGNEANHSLKRSIEVVQFRGRDKPAPREWIADNIMAKGHAACFYGEGGTAKSYLAMHFGLCVASPEKRYWMAHAVKTAPVLYLDFELDADEQHRRMLGLCEGEGIEVPAGFYYMSGAGANPGEVFEAAAEVCRDKGVALAVVDSVGFALDGDSEAARDVLAFYKRYIDPLKDAGATPLLIDHQAKIIKGEKYSDKQAFGSVYKTNAARSVFQVRGSRESNRVTATFKHTKNNFGWREDDFTLDITFEGERVTIERRLEAVPDPDRNPNNQERVLEALRTLAPTTAKKIAADIDMPLKSVRNAISALAKDGEISPTGDVEDRERVFVPGSQPTKGTGTGTKDLTPSEARAVQSLITDAGYSPEEARAEVLGCRDTGVS